MNELPETDLWPVTDVNLACMDCDRVMYRGTPYATRLVAMTPERDALSEVVCVYCVIGPAVFCPTSVPDSAADLT